MRKGTRIKLLVKLGVFFVVAGFLAAMEIGTLTGPNVGKGNGYHAIFATPDGVSGLRAGNPVRVSGVAVGKVSEIKLVDATHAEVSFSANGNQPITDHTWAVVRYANLLGQRYLALTRSGTGAEHDLRPGATIPANRTQPALSLTALFNGFRPLFATLSPKQVNALSQDIVDVLQGQSDRIADLVARTADLTGNLAERNQTFSTVLDSMAKLLGTVAKHDDQLAEVVTTLQGLTAQVHQDGPAILGSLSAVDKLVGSVGGLFDKLNQHGLPQLIDNGASLGNVLAKNTPTLQKLVTGFTSAFATFDRVTQNGNWLNVYFCNLDIKTYGQVSITLAQIVSTIGGFLGGPLGAGVGGVVDGLLGGLGITGLQALQVPVPLSLPNGRVGSSTQHSQVCS